MLDRRLRILKKAVKSHLVLRSVSVLIVISGNEYFGLIDFFKKILSHFEFAGQARAGQVAADKNLIDVQGFKKSRKRHQLFVRTAFLAK